MRSLTLIAEEKAAAEAAAQQKEQERQERLQTLEAAKAGEHLTDDFEPVEAEGERVFSQDDLNNIIRDRLTKAKTKYSESAATMAEKLTGYEKTLEEREKTLCEREHIFEAKQELAERGYDTDESMLKLILGVDIEDTKLKIDELDNLTMHSHTSSKGKKKDIIREVIGLHDLE